MDRETVRPTKSGAQRVEATDLGSGASRTRVEVAGKYRLIAALGHGGMADVYLAVNKGIEGFTKLAVVKRLRPGLVGDPDFLKMFLQEARLAARLNHPNIVDTYEVGHDEQDYYIAMEYLDGQSYHAMIQRLGHKTPLTFAMEVRVLIETLGALQYAHDMVDFDGTPMQLVHRDVSPQNVFVTYNGQVKLVDFGIAKAINSSVETVTGMIKGKVPYMAPEQARGEKSDGRVDIYAVGVMLWEAAAGRRRWKGQADSVVLAQLFDREPPKSPQAAERGLPAQVDEICLKALAPKAEDRFATCAEFAAELEELLRSMKSPVAPREIGKMLAGEFASDRDDVKKIIERQLQSLQRMEDIGDVTVSEARYGVLPSLRPSGPIDPSSASRAAVELNAARNATGRSRGMLLGAAIAIVIVGVAGIGAILSTKSPPAPAATGPLEATPPQASSQVVVAPEVRVSIAVRPADATLYWRDQRVSNPFVISVKKDGATYPVRAEAERHRPWQSLIVADRDVLLEVGLEPLGAAPGAAVKTRPPASMAGRPNTPTPPSPTSEPRQPTKKPTFDTDDPWR